MTKTLVFMLFSFILAATVSAVAVQPVPAPSAEASLVSVSAEFVVAGYLGLILFFARWVWSMDAQRRKTDRVLFKKISSINAKMTRFKCNECLIDDFEDEEGEEDESEDADEV